MREIRVWYHWEPEGWWAESPDLPTFSAAGDTFQDVRDQTWSALPFFCEEDVQILEQAVPMTPHTTGTASGHLLKLQTA